MPGEIKLNSTWNRKDREEDVKVYTFVWTIYEMEVRNGNGTKALLCVGSLGFLFTKSWVHMDIKVPMEKNSWLGKIKA